MTAKVTTEKNTKGLGNKKKEEAETENREGRARLLQHVAVKQIKYVQLPVPIYSVLLVGICTYHFNKIVCI